jgi:radical SAM superfamily enzyme YgiQ (UPF0313 family)|tara:strand:+ start:1060 stop:3087 length:2028 start_codon:yes stop_codon:yes gene_type:complete
MTKIKIGTAQINNGFAGQYYLPYSIGILQAYFIHNSEKFDSYEFLPTIYKREPLSVSVKKLENCDIALFSSYVWNEKISLAIAKELKKKDPNKFIIFGGPSVPDNTDNRAELFLKKNKFIDICVHQEGERTSMMLLENFPNSNYEKIPNISYIKENKYFNNPNIPRLKTFEKAPSPYLCGVFDNLIKENPKERWLASWETNRGCPFSCAYCDWGSATNSKVSKMEIDRVFDEMDWFSQNKIEFIFCCDANFGMLPRDYDIALKAVENKKKYGYPHVLSVQNTKNARERAYKVQKLLADSGLSKGVTLAMQSVDSHTLKEIKRDNISIADYQELQRRFTKDGITTYTEFILALPGDTYDSFANGVSEVIEAGQHNRIQFNNLSILPNAEMANSDYISRNKIETIKIPIVNPHGSLDETPADGILEEQELVISTKDLSQDDWVKTRVYASISEFFYFNKVLQIPILFLHKLTKKSIKEIFEDLISLKDNNKYPILSSIITSIHNHASAILQGGAEFRLKKEWLGIYWPPGEYEYISLLKNNKFDDFYKESQSFILENVYDKKTKEILEECFMINKKMMRLPFEDEDEIVFTKYNIVETFNLMKESTEFEIKEKNILQKIIKRDFAYKNWEDWMQEVIWYGHRSGKYSCEIVEDKLESKKILNQNKKDTNLISNSIIA